MLQTKNKKVTVTTLICLLMTLCMVLILCLAVTIADNTSRGMAFAASTDEINEYEVIFDNGVCDSGPESVMATYGQPMPSVERPIRIGYYLVGYYYVNERGSRKYYYDGEMNSLRNWDYEEDGIVLTAEWDIINYLVSLIEGDFAFTVQYGEELPQAPMPTKDGYVFNGYFDENGKQIYDKNMNPTGVWEPDTPDDMGAYFLYPQWCAIYNVNYELNGGVIGEPNPIAISKADNVKLSEPTRSGQYFDSWLCNNKRVTNSDQIIDLMMELGVTEITVEATWASTKRIYITEPFAELFVTEGATSVYMETAFDSNCTIYVGQNVGLFQLYGYDQIFNMNIVILAYDDIHVEISDMVILAHSGKPAIDVLYAETLYLHTYNSVYIEGSTQSSGNGMAAIRCTNFWVSLSDDLTIKGGDGRDGALNGENYYCGGNAGAGIIAYGDVFICDDVTIIAGTPGDGADGHVGAYGGKGAEAILVYNGSQIIIENNLTVYLYSSENGRDGQGA